MQNTIPQKKMDLTRIWNLYSIPRTTQLRLNGVGFVMVILLEGVRVLELWLSGSGSPGWPLHAIKSLRLRVQGLEDPQP